MLKLKLVLFLLIIFSSLYSQSYTVSGYVEDVNSGERIIGAYVIDSISKNIAQTNNFGFYILKDIGVKSAIQSKYIGLRSKMIYLSIDRDTVLNISMQPAMELHDVVVTSSVYKNNVNKQLGLTTISIKQLILIPALGEPDLLKSLQNQPGIEGGVEGSAGIFVRGGGEGENLFMLDDVPMYNVSHLYGFISAFNSCAIKDIKLFKGCFPARYGGRVSSVIDLRSREGNNKAIKGELSLGIISSKLTLEGPLVNDKTTFIISGRRSYFDLYSSTIKKMKLLDNNFPSYYFYDFNIGINHTFSIKDKIYLSAYKSNDHILNINESPLTGDNSESLLGKSNETSGWGNLISSMRWVHTYSNGLFENSTIAYSTYNYFTLNEYSSNQQDSIQNKTLVKDYSASYKSGVTDLIIKTDFNYSISNINRLNFGIGNTFHKFRPGENIYIVTDQELGVHKDTSFINNTLRASEPFIYLEDEFNVSPKLKINAGLRFSGFISQRTKLFNLEPRFSINYVIKPQLVIKTGYSRMVQYIHLLSTSGVSMPTDIWLPALKGLSPLISDQINGGISYELNKIYLFSIEAYKKWLTNTTDFRNGTSIFTDLSPWYEKTIQGHGNSKGIEISIEKEEGNLSGSINYTISSATRNYSDLNNGQTFAFKYDRLHNFNISVNYLISKKWNISALWLYGTGYPVTIPIEKYSPALNLISKQGYIPVYYYPSPNNVRLPSYHRLDLGVHFTTQSHLGEHTLSFDIFNAYNRKNPVNMYHWDNYSFKYTYLLPIIPSFTYTLKFK